MDIDTFTGSNGNNGDALQDAQGTPPSPESVRLDVISSQEEKLSGSEQKIQQITEAVEKMPTRGYTNKLMTLMGRTEGKEYDQRQQEIEQAQDQSLQEQAETNKGRIWKAFKAGVAGGFAAFGVNALVVGGISGPFSPAWAAIIGATAIGTGAYKALKEAQKIKQEEITYKELARDKEKNVQAKSDNEQKIRERLEEMKKGEIKFLNNNVLESTKNINKNHKEIITSLNTKLSKPVTDKYGIEKRTSNIGRIFNAIKGLTGNKEYIDQFNNRNLFSKIRGLSEDEILQDFKDSLFGKDFKDKDLLNNTKFVLTMFQDYKIPIKIGSGESAEEQSLSLSDILLIKDRNQRSKILRLYQLSLKESLDKKSSMNDLLNHLVKTDPRNLVMPIGQDPKSVKEGSNDIDILARYRYLLRDNTRYSNEETPVVRVTPEDEEPKGSFFEKLNKKLEANKVYIKAKERIAKITGKIQGQINISTQAEN